MKKEEPKQLTTEVWGLNFFLKGKRLCWVTRTPQGKETRYWMDVPPKALKAIEKVVNEHLEAEAEDAKLTPAELAEKYQEMMGS